MFSIKETDDGFMCLCNDVGIVHAIPSESLANELVTAFKALDWINWASFPSLYITENLAIEEAIKSFYV